MKKVFLIGDSIRMGYDKYVKEALLGAAEVYYPAENCRFAVNVLRFAHQWKEQLGLDEEVDLVHWNAGLWDVLEPDGEPMMPIDAYASHIARVDRRLRQLFPKAKLVFATSTPVIDGGKGFYVRHNSTIEEYNKRAIEALAETDTVINDLYSIAAKFPESYHSDVTHYKTPEGTENIGGAVITVICRELGIKANEVKIANFEPEKYTAENIGM